MAINTKIVLENGLVWPCRIAHAEAGYMIHIIPPDFIEPEVKNNLLPINLRSEVIDLPMQYDNASNSLKFVSAKKLSGFMTELEDKLSKYILSA